MFLSKEERIDQKRAKEEAKLKAVEDEKKRRAIVNKIIVTTSGLSCKYEVLGPIYFNMKYSGLSSSSLYNLSRKYEKEIDDEMVSRKRAVNNKKDWNFDYGKFSMEEGDIDKAFYVSVQELKERAFLIDSDAIICMKYDFDLVVTPNSIAHYYFHMYGTAVRLKQDVFENE
jgi:hypothetical protein